MKITYIVSGITRSVFFEHTAVALRDKGYDIDFILVGNRGNEFELFLKSNNFDCFVIDLKGWISYPACIKQIYNILKNKHPDIVHTHLTSANILGLPAAKLAGIKLRVFTKHSGQTEHKSLKQKLYDNITTAFSEYAIAITKREKEALVREKYKKDNIEIIHHGFDIERFMRNDANKVSFLKNKYNPKGKSPVIGIISRCVEWKGIQYAIPAYKRILEDYPNALLCLFNFSEDEGYSSVINKILEEIPRSSYIKVDFESNVYDMYKLFDVFVHIPIDPISEAFGQVYVESLASGIPSVFTLSGIANDFVVDNQNAKVVDFRNSSEVYVAIKKYLEDPIMSRRIAEKGVSSVKEEFTLHRYISNLNKFYKRITKNGK